MGLTNVAKVNILDEDEQVKVEFIVSDDEWKSGLWLSPPSRCRSMTGFKIVYGLRPIILLLNSMEN